MVITAAVLATFLKDPFMKACGWTFKEALKGTRNQNIEKSLQTLSEKILEVIKVKTIYKGDDSIDLHEFYVATKIDKIQGAVDSILNISNQSIVLEGTVGQGKSIFMRYLTYQEAIKGQRIPIFFELRRLEDSQRLKAAISEKIKNWIPLFDDDDFEKFADSGSLVLFLDGFDEVPYEKVGRLINEIEGWCERYKGLQIVVSSRPEADIQKSNFFRVFKLSSYDFNEQSKLIDKLVNEEESRNLLKDAIRNSTTEIENLLTTPLMVTLFVMNYRSNLEIPKNQSEFYKELFSVLISRHDKTKPGYKRPLNSGLSETELQKIFEQFCFVTSNNDKLILKYTESIDFIEKCLESQKIKANSTDILEDFSKVICLLLKDGLEYSFIHKSIQEYFYASFILRKSEKAKEIFYKKCIENGILYNRLENVLDFLKTNDTYNYNKFFKKIILSDYISCYSIVKDHNTIIDNIYCGISEEDDNNIRGIFILNNMGSFVSNILCCPDSIDNLFFRINNILSQDRHHFFQYRIDDIDLQNHEYLEKLSSILDKQSLILLRKETIDIGNHFLIENKDIENYISQLDNLDLDL